MTISTALKSTSSAVSTTVTPKLTYEESTITFAEAKTTNVEVKSMPTTKASTTTQWKLTKALVEELERLVGSIPPNIVELINDGHFDAIVDWLEDEDIHPSKNQTERFNNLKKVMDFPTDLLHAIDIWNNGTLPREAIDELEAFADQPLPKKVSGQIQDGNHESFIDWLEEIGAKPLPEEFEKIAESAEDAGVPAGLMVKLTNWYEDLSRTTTIPPKTTTKPLWKLGRLSAGELERMVGEPIPADIKEHVNDGNYEPFLAWLEEKDIHTSKTQFNRLKAAADVYDYPDEMIIGITDWYERNLLLGAVKELSRFAGHHLPKEISDKIEAGDHKAYTDWLDAKEASPPPQDYLRLQQRGPKRELPSELLEAVEKWYEKFGHVFTTTPETSTETSVRSPAPGATTTPPFPLSESEKLATSIMQSLGCASLLGIIAGTVALYALIVRDPSIERFLHLNQELALLLAHCLILFMRDRTDFHVPCKLVSIALQSAFISVFAFMGLEAFQAYTISAAVIPSKGVFNKKQFAAIGWILPAVYSGVISVFLHGDYLSYWSCWLNMGAAVSMATIGPLAVLAGATVVLVEAGGMDSERAALDGADLDQATAAAANRKGLLFVLPANIASWFLGLVAVYEAKVALYGMVFALNLSLALAIFAFHTLGSPKVLGWLKAHIPCLG